MNQSDYSFDIGPVGTIQTINDGFQIGSLKIDNPTGMWLLIEPINKYIPPNTLGWVTNLIPKRTQLRLLYVNAPYNGAISVVSGGPIIVQVYGDYSIETIGTDYSLVPTMNNLTTAINNLSGGFGSNYTILNVYGSFGGDYLLSTIPGNANIIAAPVAGQSIYLIGFSCTVSAYDPLASSPEYLRGYYIVSISNPTPLFNCQLNQYNPNFVMNINNKAYTSTNAINLAITNYDGASKAASFTYTAQYYIA